MLATGMPLPGCPKNLLPVLPATFWVPSGYSQCSSPRGPFRLQARAACVQNPLLGLALLRKRPKSLHPRSRRCLTWSYLGHLSGFMSKNSNPSQLQLASCTRRVFVLAEPSAFSSLCVSHYSMGPTWQFCHCIQISAQCHLIREALHHNPGKQPPKPFQKFVRLCHHSIRITW